jgi:hypothetical protein
MLDTISKHIMIMSDPTYGIHSLAGKPTIYSISNRTNLNYAMFQCLDVVKIPTNIKS